MTQDGITMARRLAMLIIFVISIYAPPIAGLFGESGGVSKLENRVLAQIPDIEPTWDSINTFPERFEKYFSDNFAGRIGLVRGYIRIHSSMDVSWTKDVIIGKNGWLLYAPEILSYRKTRPFTDIQMAMWRWKMRLLKEWLEKRGVKLMFIIAPNKSSIYPEQVPDHINVAGQISCFDQISKAAHDLGIEFVDPREELAERKKKDEVYIKTDTHWNDYGALASYLLAVKPLGKWFPGLSPIPESSMEFTAVDSPGGDLANMLGLPEGSAIYRAKMVNVGKFVSKWNPIYGNDLPNKKMSFRLDTGNSGPRALVLRDSFGSLLLQCLSTHFSHITAVWGHEWFSGELVENEKPDVVIYEIVERFLMAGLACWGTAAIS